MKVVEAGHEGERLDIGPSLYPVIDERSLAKPIDRKPLLESGGLQTAPL
jgi:hypothetical protein